MLLFRDLIQLFWRVWIKKTILWDVEDLHQVVFTVAVLALVRLKSLFRLQILAGRPVENIPHLLVLCFIIIIIIIIIIVIGRPVENIPYLLLSAFSGGRGEIVDNVCKRKGD